MLAAQTPGVLYVEGPTDVEILRAFATVLQHPVREVLTRQLFWHRYSDQTRDGAPGFSSRQHFESLRLYFPELRALEILDRDGNQSIPETEVRGVGLQVTRWRRYEIESYLVHPGALERFVLSSTAPPDPEGVRAAMRASIQDLLTPDFLADPMNPKRPAEAVLASYKARVDILPPILSAGGLPAFPYQRFHEIAAQMLPSEIAPEVRSKLDAICLAFGIPLPPAGAAP
jgi:hypothetical protein